MHNMLHTSETRQLLLAADVIVMSMKQVLLLDIAVLNMPAKVWNHQVQEIPLVCCCKRHCSAKPMLSAMPYLHYGWATCMKEDYPLIPLVQLCMAQPPSMDSCSSLLVMLLL